MTDTTIDYDDFAAYELAELANTDHEAFKELQIAMVMGHRRCGRCGTIETIEAQEGFNGVHIDSHDCVEH